MSSARPPVSVRTAIAVALLLTLITLPTHSNRLAAAQGSPLAINGGLVYQTLDGIGVNAMSFSYKNGELLPALDLLTSDLGSGLWRVIIECAEGCEDTNDDANPSNFNWTYYNALYETPRFQALWGVLTYLQDKPGGILINVMARAPAWMGGSSITTEDEWVEMIVSFAYYARVVKGLRFEMLSPINEPDADGIEGPLVSAAQSARLMRKIVDRLPALGLADLKLVPPETTNPDIAVSSYIPAMLGDPVVMGQVDQYAVHSYYGLSGGLDAYIKSTPYPTKTFWVTEFADKCYVGCDHGTEVPDEWTFARNTVLNLFSHVRDGATGLIVYEGYDAWYDHHSGIGTTGLLAYNVSTGTYTPRLRYYAVKQAMRFVPPGSRRVDASSPDPSINVLAFVHPTGGRVTIVGYNASSAPLTLNATLSGLPAVSSFELYQTSQVASFQRGPNASVSGGTFSAEVAANAFFTFTTAVPDTSPPSVRLDDPADGSTVSSGAVPLRATASDDVGVASVQFQVDSLEPTSDVTSPYRVDWDTTMALNGLHTITAIARDAAGNENTSTISVTVSNPDPVPVPVVGGLTQAEAAAAITGAGLKVGTVTTVPNATVAAGSVISESPVAGTLVAPGSAVNLVVSSGPPITVPNVVNFTQAAATTALTDAGLTVGTVTTVSSATVAAGSVISENPVAGTLVTPGSAVSLVVSTGPAALAVDKVAFSDGSGTRTISGFSTIAAGQLLVAFVAADGPSPGTQTVTVSGAGLTWTLVRRVNTQAGTSEIWRTTAPAVLTNVSITSTQGTGNYYQSLTLVAFTGAAGTGVSAGANAPIGAPTVSLTTTRAGSLVYGVGNDWDRATARTLGANQTLVHQYLAPVGDTMWVQNRSGSIASAGTVVSINDTAPTNDRWNLVAVEILAPAPLVPVPHVVNQTQAAATTAITGAQLVVGTITNEASETVAVGSVISQDPIAGIPVTANSAVNLVISLGPSPVQAPYVVSLTQAAATDALTAAGLVRGTITNVSSVTVPADSVISQDPIAGTLVPTPSAVNLVVSTGPPLVSVPNVVTQTQTAATTAIQGVGLRVGTVTSASSVTVPAGSVISQNPVGGSQAATGSAVSLVVSTGPVLVAVPNVVTQTQVAASTAITGASLRVGTVTNASSATVAAGSVISQSPVGGTQVATGSAVNLVVSTGPPPPIVDKVVFSDGNSTRTTAQFSTSAPNELLVAFVSSDGPSSGSQTATVTGAGLTWTLVRRANTQSGTSEVWQARATAQLTAVTVRSTPGVSGYRQSLTVVTFRGASGIGASAIANGPTGAPSVTLMTTKTSSVVYGVGSDRDRAVARTLGPSQVMVHEWVATAVTDTFWVQRWNVAVPSAGTSIRLNCTAPTNDRWNFVSVEIVP